MPISYILKTTAPQLNLEYTYLGGENIAPVVAESDRDGLIDVISDCQLFANKIPSTAKDKIPFIFFEEYELTSNALLSQFQYLGKLLANDLPSDGRSVTERGFNYIVSAMADFIRVKDSGDGNNRPITTEGLKAELNKTFNNIDTQRKTVINSAVDPQYKTLQPYGNMYALKETGFKYIMPYYDDKMYGISNNFNDTFTSFFGGEGGGGKLPSMVNTGISFVKDLFGAYLTLQNISQPSAYVEFPKYFAPGDYESYNVKFQLLNTIEKEYVQAHYDFLFLLAFQNLPFRESIIKVRPSKLYSVTIPGTTVLPYCYMDSINVNYVGNRRIIKLDKFNLVGETIEKTKTDCIVPDCYDVTIKFTSLLRPAANFMVSPNINVRTNTTPLLQPGAPNQQ